jgi:DNA-binding transcriptional LysR family regulator
VERYVVIACDAGASADPLQLLRERPLVRYDRSLWSGQIAENYLRQHRIRPNDRIELDALDAIAVLVRRGLGISLVPDLALWSEGLTITKYALPEPAPLRELGLVWPVTSAYARILRIVEQDAFLALGSKQSRAATRG